MGLAGDRVAAIMDRLTAIAHKLNPPPPRTIDQLRADVFLHLREGRHRGEPHRRSLVDIRVDLATLVGLDERSGDIPGWGPVIADIARQAVESPPEGEWRVVVTDPDHSAVLWDGTTRRRPTAAQRRWVEARQPTCTFPGGRVPAQRSDLDHAARSPEADGPWSGPSSRAAATTTASDTKAAGPSTNPNPASICGPPPRPHLHHPPQPTLTAAAGGQLIR